MQVYYAYGSFFEYCYEASHVFRLFLWEKLYFQVFSLLLSFGVSFAAMYLQSYAHIHDVETHVQVACMLSLDLLIVFGVDVYHAVYRKQRTSKKPSK